MSVDQWELSERGAHQRRALIPPRRISEGTLAVRRKINNNKPKAGTTIRQHGSFGPARGVLGFFSEEFFFIFGGGIRQVSAVTTGRRAAV